MLVLSPMILDFSVCFNCLSRITLGNTNRELYSLLLLICIPYSFGITNINCIDALLMAYCLCPIGAAGPGAGPGPADRA